MKPTWTLDQVVSQLTNWQIRWGPASIAYSFYTASWGHHQHKTNFSPFTPEQQEFLTRHTQLVADVANITFHQVADNGIDPSPANRRIGFYNVNSADLPFRGHAHNFFVDKSTQPFGTMYGADVAVNLHRAGTGPWGFGGSNQRMLLHELLHTLGLDHAGDYDGDGFTYEKDALFYQDSSQYTVMSYWSAAETGADHAMGNLIYSPTTPLLFDIAALQKLYGANMSTRTGDTVYGFNSTAGRPAFDLALHPYSIFTIWDAGGTDTLDLSGYASGARINLEPGSFTDSGEMTRNISIAYGVTIENAVGGSGNDEIQGNGTNNVLSGGGGDDALFGGDGNDELFGGNGNDVLAGGRGADFLVGGAGSDRFVYSFAAESPNGSPDRIRDFEAGVDKIDLLALDPSSVTRTEFMHDGLLYSIVDVSTGGTTMTIRVDARLSTSDFILPPPNLHLTGTDGADHLQGGDRHDILDGGAGDDAMHGGAGNDTYYVDSSGDRVFEHEGQGFDRVAASVSFELGGGAEIELIETVNQSGTEAIAITGSDYANTIRGNAGSNLLSGRGGNDVLWGFDGDDYLVGGAGNDVLHGGAGNDSYYVDDAGDIIYESDGEGQDRISASVTYVLRSESAVETIEASDRNSAQAINLTGSMFANTIFGNAGSNILYGEGGNDVLWGYGGDDYLVGGIDDDVMWGGTGNDTYYVDSTGDRIYELSGEGYDRVAAIISITLPDNAEIELLEAVNLASTDRMDLGGSDFSNTITGNAGVNILRGHGGNDVLYGYGGDDFLDGGAHDDTMYGGTGNDTYYVDSSGDLVIELDNQGIDRIATSVSLELTGGSAVEVLEAVNWTGTQAMNLTGSDTANSISGNAGSNVINGRGGNDVLAGGGGADIFQFTTALGPNNVDKILDFQTGIDKIALDDAIFTGFNPGSLSASQFAVGAQAGDGDDRIIYNPETGALMFDPDGSGVAAPVQFAILQPGLSVTASDFMVI